MRSIDLLGKDAAILKTYQGIKASQYDMIYGNCICKLIGVNVFTGKFIQNYKLSRIIRNDEKIFATRKEIRLTVFYRQLI